MNFLTRCAQLDDRPALKALWQDTFHESQSFLDWFFDARFLPESCVVSEWDGRIVSALHGLPTHLFVRDSILPCMLVSGVATLPEFRHRGLMRRGFERLFSSMRARAIPLALLTPVDFAIYAPLDQYAASDVQLVKLAASVARPAFSGQFGAPSLSGNLSALYRCYAQSARAYSVSLARSYADFVLKCADYASDGGRCLAVLDAQARVRGYCVYFEAGDTLNGEECFARTEADYRQTFAALARLATGKNLTLKLPPDISLNCPQADVTTRAHCALGVADVIPLLKATGLSGGSVAVSGERNGPNPSCFTLDGRPTDAPAQIELSAGRLAQWAVGYRSMAELAANGDAVVFDPDAPAFFDRVGKRPCFTADEY